MESATCIVAVSDNISIWMGEDSVAIDSNTDLLTLNNSKVFCLKDTEGRKWLLGFSGSYRFGQLLQYSLEIPSLGEEDLLRFMVNSFVPAMQQCIQKGCVDDRESVKTIVGSCLVGVKGRIFCIGNKYSVQESVYGYHALGCGAPYAYGSLFTSVDLDPHERVCKALEAAEEFSAGVRRPFAILHT